MYSPQPPEGSPYPQQGPYQPQNPYQPQQPSIDTPYTSPSAYPPQNPYPQQNPYDLPQTSNPYQSQPQGPYASQQPASPYVQPVPQSNLRVSNRRAKNAMVYGIISVVLALFTLVNAYGFAGLITGSFAIIYGFMGLNLAGKLPNNSGRGQAITGLVLGIVALLLLIFSFIIRSANPGS
jgi:hypothetical protein